MITAQPDHKLRALKAGAKDFVSKPFDLAEVLMRVHNMLEVRLLNTALEQRVQASTAELDTSMVELHEREKALRESDHRLRTITENINEGLVVASVTGQVLHWNNAARAMFALSGEDKWLRKLGEFADTFELMTLDGRVLNIEEWPLARVIAGEHLHDLELRLRRFGVDRSFVLSFSGAVVTGDGGTPIAFLSFADITERKRAEGDLREAREGLEQRVRDRTAELFVAKERAEAADRLKSTFLANMSHELRTPLNAIIGFSELLKDGLMGQMTDQQRGFIGDIFSSGTHLLSLINDILDLSKVEAGKMTLDIEPVQVSSLFVNSLSIIREKAATRHVRVDFKAAEELGSIQADARKVKQIAYNLLSNAIKFTKEGGEVILRARRVPRAEVGQLSGPWTGRSFPLADNEFAEFLEISVTDNGIGIPPEGLKQLFKPFSQIDSGLARKFEGTGLGLALVKLLAELHGGTVAVQSAVGKGSCFTVWLPLRAPEEKALAPGDRAAAPQVEGLADARIALVLEDDLKSANLIRVQLEAEGFRVLHAASAESALRLAEQHALSLITVDIMLPDMDGWDFFSRLKQVPGLRHIPVVMISGVADPEKGFSLGAAAVLQKPISRHVLYETLVDLGLFPFSQREKLTVLVVDDDPKSVELIAVFIQGLAMTVLRAYGGREAIDTARRELPDLIVLDLMMPEVSGFDVVAALSETHETARIPILVVTAKDITAEDRAKLYGPVTADHGQGGVRPRTLPVRSPAGPGWAATGRLISPRDHRPGRGQPSR